MSDIWIIGGTTEGRKLAQSCDAWGIAVHVSVTSEYGSLLLNESSNLRITNDRMDLRKMEEFLDRNGISLVLDATHPYAELATVNAREACQNKGICYRRVLRDEETLGENYGLIRVANTEDAVEYLRQTEGAVFLSTGSKELEAFTVLPDYENRIYARILPDSSGTKFCENMGIRGKHIIAMQGPFSRELNREMFRHTGVSYLVTKESGRAGGFREKVEAAADCGMSVIVIGRPTAEQGISLEEAERLLAARRSPQVPLVYLVGVGMGSVGQMTVDAVEAVKSSEVVLGAERMLSNVRSITEGKMAVPYYQPNEVADWLKEHPSCRSAAVLFSGDTGFYSGCKKMEDHLRKEGFQIQILPGISTVSYLCSRLGQSWEDVALGSLHGRDSDLEQLLSLNKKVFLLLGGDHSVPALCLRLVNAGAGDLVLHVGERLSYDDERITSGTVRMLADGEFDSLCAVLIESRQEEIS